MAILAWGKGLLETAPVGDSSKAQWTAIDTPKEDTLKLTPTAGTEVTANEEGGDIVDSRAPRVTFQLEWDTFVKKGQKRPFEDVDGHIDGEHMFRYTPEDEDTEGFLIERSTVHAEESFSTADGKLLHYVARVLKPEKGGALKPYIKTAAANASAG